MSPLDPQHLTPSNSLNRVQVIDLPGIFVDSEVKGKNGYELVSAESLSRLIRQYIDSLNLDPALSDHELRLALDACLRGKGARFRTGVLPTAEIVARRFGRNLGYLLLTLKRGDAVNRAARAEWDDSYWEHWGQINRVWLGGGLVSGRLGERMKQHALSIFTPTRITDFSLEVSPYDSALPLVGAARFAPLGVNTALIFDFGSTMIKRACAIYEEGELAELHCLPSFSTGWEKIERAFFDPMDAAAALLNRIVTVIVDTRRDVRSLGLMPPGTIRASFAAYIRDGHPMKAQGGAYIQLRRLTDNLQSELARQVGARSNQEVDLRFFHDGTSAATTYAGAENTAVITIGTALGVGFPPPAEGLRPMSKGFVVADAK